MLTTTVKTGGGAMMTLDPTGAPSPVRPAPVGRRVATGSASGSLLPSAEPADAHRLGAWPPWPGEGRLPKTRTPRRRGAGAAHLIAAAQQFATQAPRPRGTGTASNLTTAPSSAPETDARLGTPPPLPERRAAQWTRGGDGRGGAPARARTSDAGTGPRTAPEARGAGCSPAKAAEPPHPRGNAETDAQLAHLTRRVQRSGVGCTLMTQRGTTSTSPTTPRTWTIAATLRSSGTYLDSEGPKSEGAR